MELQRAREIVQAVADGIDPTTGEALPPASVFNSPTVVRALFKVLEPVKSANRPAQTLEQKQQDNIDNGRPKNAGLAWTKDLKKQLEESFSKGASAQELATQFERTTGAITAELKKQGLIEDDEEPRYG